MSTACAGSLLASLAQVPDPRGRKGRHHPLADMLAATVSGLFSGVVGDAGLAEWVQDLPMDLCHRMGFTRRPPKLDCFRDLLPALDTEALNTVLRQVGSRLLSTRGAGTAGGPQPRRQDAARLRAC